MFDTDNIIPKEINLLDGQIDIFLRALELYAFNLHNTWSVSVDDSKEELRNALLFHTYEGLLAQKNGEYKIAYDVIEDKCVGYIDTYQKKNITLHKMKLLCK